MPLMKFGKALVGALCAMSCASCSFVSSRPPPSAPEERTAKAAAKCGNFWYPLADTVSVLAGATWVVSANQKEEEDRPSTTTSADGTVTIIKQGSGDTHDAERIFGYSVMGLFGASALFGYYVEIKCGELRREVNERDQRRVEQAIPPPRPDMPGEVAGFSFGMTPELAQRACVQKNQEWQLQGSVAHCNPKSGSAPVPSVRLEFQSGTLSRIALLHEPPADQLAPTYDRFYAAFLSRYGSPQVDRAVLTSACSGALAECLKNGEKPKGAAWYWPNGSVELHLVWRDDRALLEERYSREEIVEQ
jgi:hypothetical protein